MIYKTHILEIKTTGENQMINITSKIHKLVVESEITIGHVILFVPHTTAAVTINENADPDVKTDMLLGLNKVFVKDKDYIHYEGNSHAHIKSSLVGIDQTILIENRKMLLGTWQGIYFMEFDGPRNRKIIVRITGE